MSEKSRTPGSGPRPSISERFTSFFSKDKKKDKEWEAEEAASRKKSSVSTDASSSSSPLGAPLIANAHTPASPTAATSAASPSSSSSSSTPSFFDTLKQKALHALDTHRADSARSAAFKSTGLLKVNSRMFQIQPTECVQHSHPSVREERVERQQLEALHAYLSTYHEGSYLILDIGCTLNAWGVGEEAFPAARLALEFGAPPAASGNLGTLEAATRITAAVKRWWAADDSNQNIIILACTPPSVTLILSAIILYNNLRFEDISAAVLSVLVRSENRLSASLHLRGLCTAHKKFLSDFALLQSWDPTFSTNIHARVWVHEMVIHRLPQLEEEGTRVLVVIIANRTQFLYTSQSQGGGLQWVPTSDADPATLSIALAIEFGGEIQVKIFHVPVESSVSNPRRLIFETKLSSAIMCLPCWKIQEGFIHPQPQHAAHNPPLMDLNAAATPGSEDPISMQPVPPPTLAPQIAPPLLPSAPYPLHRLFLRKDELDLSDPHAEFDELSAHDPIAREIVYHKNFRLSLTCTPMEELKYKKDAAGAASMLSLSQSTPEFGPSVAPVIGGPSAASSSSSSSSSAAATSSLPDPILHSHNTSSSFSPASPPEVDLLKLAAAWNFVPPADAPASPKESNFLEETKFELTPVKPPRKDSDEDSGRSLMQGQGSLSLPPQHRSAASLNSSPMLRPIASSSSVVSSSSASSSPAPLRRLTGSQSPSLPALPWSNFLVPLITVPEHARSVAGSRWYQEDKNGLERVETPLEIEKKLKAAREKQTLDALYGPGNWRKTGGQLYTLDTGGQAIDPTHSDALRQLSSMGLAGPPHSSSQHAHHSQHSHSHPIQGLSFRTRTEALEQLEQMHAHAHAQGSEVAPHTHPVSSAAPVVGPSPQQILADPNANQASKDEAYARLLQEQFREEDEMEQRMALAHAQTQIGIMQPPAAASAAAASVATPPGSAHRSSRSHRSGSSSSSSSRSGRSSRSAAAAAASAMAQAAATVPGITVAADGTLSLPSSSAAASSSSQASAGDSISAPQAEPSDEVLARALQSQFDVEIASRNLSALAAAQARTLGVGASSNPDHFGYDQRLALEELMGASQSRAKQKGIAQESIEMLPRFHLELSSKYLEEECQICRENFGVGEELRQLQCIHAYHIACIDPWLRMNRVCPVCRVPCHQMNNH